MSIAYALWGDSSFWYMIADANGMLGTETLVAGQDLVIPNKVHNSHNSSDIYRVYDPNDAIGNTSPTTPLPAFAPAPNGSARVLAYNDMESRPNGVLATIASRE